MSLRTTAAYAGQLEAFNKAEARALEQSVRTVLGRRSTGLKTSIRRQAEKSGLGKRFGQIVRSVVEPKVGTPGPVTASVFSTGIYKGGPDRPGGEVDLLTVFDQGATLELPAGRFFTIPLTPAGRKTGLAELIRAGAKLAVLWQPSHKLGVVYHEDDKARTRPLFLLVAGPIRLRARLATRAAYDRSAKGVPQAIEVEFGKRGARAVLRLGLG